MTTETNEMAISKEDAIQQLRMDQTTDQKEQEINEALIKLLEIGLICAYRRFNGEVSFKSAHYMKIHDMELQTKEKQP